MVKKNKKQSEPIIYPLGDRVLIEREPLSDTSDGGIILTEDIAENHVRYGRVLEIGPEAFEEGFDEGDRVVFNRYAGIVLGKIGDNDRVIMSHKEMIAVVKMNKYTHLDDRDIPDVLMAP